MSTNLDDLKELDQFDKFKSYIKNFILADESQTLLKLIYYSNSSPLTQPDLENPYEIFEVSSNGKYGVVIFGQKNNDILNSETVVLLISFSSETSEDSDCINTVFTEFNIILKGSNIQQLSDESNRGYKIAELIDEQYNHAKITDVGAVEKVSFENLNVNEENCGYTLKYKSTSTSYNDSIQLYQHTQSEDSYGITRESYNLLSTTEPILVDIRPLEDDKITKDYGYDAVIKRRMICDIIPEITESSVIKHGDIYYRIEKYIEYDDYMDYTLIEAKHVTIN